MNKTSRIGRNIMQGFGAGLAFYAVALLGSEGVCHYQRINHKLRPADLEMVLEQEKKELDLSDKIEISIAVDSTINAYAQTSCPLFLDNEYAIAIHPDSLSRVAIRHELYHIAKGDCKDRMPLIHFAIGEEYYRLPFKSVLIEEPRASLYAATGIKF